MVTITKTWPNSGITGTPFRLCTTRQKICTARQEDGGTIMAVLTADPIGTPAVEAPAGDRGGTEPREHHPWEPGKYHTLAYTALGLGIAAAAFLLAWGLHGNTSSTYRIDNQWGAFTGLFILALAIERALEPFSRRLGPDTTKAKKERDRALASAPAHHRQAVAVKHQHKVDTSRRLTAVVIWGVATGFSFILCAQLNITLLQAVRTSSAGAPPFWADLLVTGLVVGAGTKPLHDLVSNIEQGKK